MVRVSLQQHVWDVIASNPATGDVTYLTDEEPDRSF